MKKMLCSLLLALISLNIMAQDFLYKKDGDSIRVSIYEIKKNVVKYYKTDDPKKGIHIMNKSDLKSICFASGREIYFNNMENNINVAPGLLPYKSYRKLKKIYSPRDYVHCYGDKHSPCGSAFASFFIPGLGECINGEWWRGVGKLISCTVLLTVGGITSYDAPTFSLICYTGAIGIDVWSIISASRIAKIKNMYEQDIKAQKPISAKLSPAVNYAATPNGHKPTVGLSLAVNF